MKKEFKKKIVMQKKKNYIKSLIFKEIDGKNH
jgi:hypothetical protein